MKLDDIHLLNPNCTGPLGKLEHPVTFLFYLAASCVCFAFTVVTYWKYNSVTVLNVVVRTRSISNVLWILFFVVTGVRALMNLIVYADPKTSHSGEANSGLFIADGILKAFEVLFLLLAFNYQRKYRSGGFLEGEVARFNRQRESAAPWSMKTWCAVYVLSTEALFITQFVATVAFLATLEILNDRHVKPLYWTYLGSLWSMCVSLVVMVTLVVKDTNPDGPSLKTKLLFLGGVVLSLPADIPAYVWQDCILCSCKQMIHLTCYDMFIMVSIFCFIAFFTALRQEFLRLNQEVQWNAVAEVESLMSSTNDSHPHHVTS